MQSYQIITDSTTDLTPALIEELGICVVPLEYTIDDHSYFDRVDKESMSYHDFYELLRAGKMSTTNQINPPRFVEAFTPYLEQGLDILYIAFSSGLSGTYGASRIAADDLAAAFPDRKIRCVDSLCASMGEGLFVYHAVMKQREGFSIDELADHLENTRLKLCHWFTVDDLNHLKRGGRVSATAAFVGSMLGIKPVLHVDDEGHLIPVSKVRGRKASLQALVDHMAETAIDPQNQMVFISHGDCFDDANYVAELIRQQMGTSRFKINFIGPVIGSHSGPGTVALFFLGETR